MRGRARTARTPESRAKSSVGHKGGDASTGGRLLELQRDAGNQAVAALVGGHADTPEALLPVQRSGPKLPEENLVTPRYAKNVRLQKAFDNAKAVQAFEPDRDAVRLIQQGLVDDGFALPKSTKPDGTLDGVYGKETADAVTAFQHKHKLPSKDGKCGRQTLRRLDELALGGGVGPGSTEQERRHALALSVLATQQRRVYDLIAKGLKTTPGGTSPDRRDVLFRNACQWIHQGKASLTVLVPTHDSTTRATKPGAETSAKGVLHAYFDRAVRYPNVGGDYPLDPSPGEKQHVTYARPGFEGTTSTDEIALVVDESKKEEMLVTTLIHEVQHAADRAEGDRPGTPQGPGRVEVYDSKGNRDLATEGDVNVYQSEFRAHWIEFPEGDAKDPYGSSTAPATNAVPVTFVDSAGTIRSQATNFKNLRQETVFHHLLKNDYPFAEPYVLNAEFRRRVDAYDVPAGVNLVNSVRVDDLVNAITACNKNMAAKHPKIVKVVTAAGILDEADRRFLRDQRLSRPFWDHGRARLNTTQFGRLRRTVGLP